MGHKFLGHPLLLKKIRWERVGKITWGLKKPLFLNIVFLPFIYIRFISPKWQQATVLHESKPEIERGRLVKMAINFKGYLYY